MSVRPPLIASESEMNACWDALEEIMAPLILVEPPAQRLKTLAGMLMIVTREIAVAAKAMKTD